MSGWEGTKLVLGKHSGRAGFRNGTQAEMGITSNDEEMQAAYEQFLLLADHKKTGDGEPTWRHWCDHQQETKDSLVRFSRNAGGSISDPAATDHRGDRRGPTTRPWDGMRGNGPVDAVVMAIDDGDGIRSELVEYTPSKR